MGQLDGKAAIATGGGSGIGKAIARAYAGEGCVVAIARRPARHRAGVRRPMIFFAIASSRPSWQQRGIRHRMSATAHE